MTTDTDGIDVPAAERRDLTIVVAFAFMGGANAEATADLLLRAGFRHDPSRDLRVTSPSPKAPRQGGEAG